MGRFLKENPYNPGIDRLGHLRQVVGGFRFLPLDFFDTLRITQSVLYDRSGGRVSYLYPGHREPPTPSTRTRVFPARSSTPVSSETWLRGRGRLYFCGRSRGWTLGGEREKNHRNPDLSP